MQVALWGLAVKWCALMVAQFILLLLVAVAPVSHAEPEESCIAVGSEDLGTAGKGDALLQGLSTRYRGPALGRSREENATSNQPHVADRGPNGADKLDSVSNLAVSVHAPREADSQLDSSEKGDWWEHAANWSAVHLSSIVKELNSISVANKKGLVDLALMQVQTQTPAAVGAVMFVTSVFLLLCMVLLLTLYTTKAPEKDVDPRRSAGSRMTETPRTPPFNGRQNPQGDFPSMRGRPPSTTTGRSTIMSNDSLTVNSLIDKPKSTLRGPGPSQESSKTTAPLSQQLVVPEDCECALVLPMPARGWTGDFGIADTRASTVLRAAVKDVVGQSSASKGAAATIEIVLSSASAPCTTVARCRKPKDGELGLFCIYRGDSDEMFATLAFKDKTTPAQARLTLAGGGYFDIDAEGNGSVRIADDQGQLHATSEPYSGKGDGQSGSAPQPAMVGGPHSMGLVRVGPLGDAGLVLCGLMCLHQLTMASQVLRSHV